MEAVKRKPFQGITNIILFNWHFYVFALLALCSLHLLKTLLPGLHLWTAAAGLFIVLTTTVSLLVSFYVYDVSNLYNFNWFSFATQAGGGTIVNINAGFDETSVLLRQKFPSAHLIVYDFYNPQKHTEVSIKRARKAYPPYPVTEVIDTLSVPLAPAYADLIFCILSAHEIRDSKERITFFEQLRKGLKPEGKIVVVEHTRGLANLLAYTVGAFHFHTNESWLTTFRNAGLEVHSTGAITPFITVYYLQTHGDTP